MLQPLSGKSHFLSKKIFAIIISHIHNLCATIVLGIIEKLTTDFAILHKLLYLALSFLKIGALLYSAALQTFIGYDYS